MPLSTIKNFYPLCITLPTENNDETCIYVKEHSNAKSSESKDKSKTVFVANAPFVGDIRTSLLLRSIFDRFGNVENVTVVRNPRSPEANTEDDLPDTFPPRWLENPCDEGKFAHVDFESRKEMKRALKAISSLDEGGITIEETEIESLRAQSTPDKETETDQSEKKPNSMTSLITRVKSTITPRSTLLEMCNSIMQRFETAEEEDRKSRLENSGPDADGFITVSYAPKVGSKKELETEGHARKALKRNRKKKTKGSQELPDFYRFQMRESKKRDLDELRERFEEDLARVKRMKEDKMFRPF